MVFKIKVDKIKQQHDLKYYLFEINTKCITEERIINDDCGT